MLDIRDATRIFGRKAAVDHVSFRIDGPALHGVPGLLNLFGIESPGLTSALAIAEEAGVRLAAGA